MGGIIGGVLHLLLGGYRRIGTRKASYSLKKVPQSWPIWPLNLPSVVIFTAIASCLSSQDLISLETLHLQFKINQAIAYRTM